MKRCIPTVMLLAGLALCPARAAISPHPSLFWPTEKPFGSYAVEIATDPAFEDIVDRDTIRNVGRYVPFQPLEPGTYHWRAGRWNGSFAIQAPENKIVLPSGSGMAEIRAALERAKKQPSTLIRFEAGTYHLHPGRDGTVFEIEETENLIIDGGGAKFVIHDIARLARVRFSEHITLRNFSVDYEGPIHTAAQVESIASDGTMELSLWPGCAPPESVESFMKEKRGLFYDPAFPRMAEKVPLVVHMKKAWVPLGGNRYRLQAARAKDVQNVKPGMVYICAPRYTPQGIELYNSEDITLADITTRYLPGIGVVANFADDIKLIRFNMLRRKNRLLGVQNGGTNIHGARIGPWVEGCRFENTGDDCNHISALMLTPIEQPEPNVVIISAQQPGAYVFSPDMNIRKGDTLAFFQRLEGRLLAEAKATQVQIRGRRTTITLDRDLPKLSLGTNREDNFQGLETTQVYNLSRACGNFVFRNNAFVRGRRTGILAKSGPGLIEGNRFEELGGGGVEIWNAPYEGLYAHDILIRSNLFRRGGLSAKKGAPAPAIWAQIFAGRPPQKLHRNLRIIGNRIVDYPANGIEINDTVGVRIENNTFERRELDRLRVPGSCMIESSRTEKCIVKGNHFNDSRYQNPRKSGKPKCPQ